MNGLDREIADTFSLLGVLLVFVVAYGSVLLPQIEELVNRSVPDVAADRETLITRLGSHKKLTAGLSGLVVLVLLLLLPLTLRVAESLTFHGTFRTPRVGLLVVDTLLVGMLIVGIWLHRRVGKRETQLRG